MIFHQRTIVRGRSVYLRRTYGMGKALITEDERKFGLVVRKLRLEQGFTQEAFADYIGIDRSYQGRIERGEASVTLNKISLIAKALKVSRWELIRMLDETSS